MRLSGVVAGCVTTIALVMTNTTASTELVDAVTAATVNKTCKFTMPYAVTGTTATIVWTEGRTDGTATISWGTDLAKMTSRAVTANERSAKTVVLTGLTSSTLYNVRYEAAKSGEVSYAATGTFTTLGGTGVKPIPVKTAEKLMALQHQVILLGSETRSGDLLTVTDLTGRKLFAHRIAAGENSVSLPLNVTGVLVFSLQRAQSIITTRTFTVKI
jgi:hypothetical protein